MLVGQWRYGLIAVAVIIVISSLVPQSFAHPIILNSSPKAFETLQSSPKEVNLFFSEAIELGYSTIKVIGPDGSRVDTNDKHSIEGDTASMGVTLQPNLPDGQYTVTARVLSAVDGHVIENTLIFGVGTPVSASPNQSQQDILSPGNSAARFPGMVGQIVVVGAAFATLWLWKPIAKVPWLSSALSEARVKIDRNMMRLVIISTGLVLASGVAMIIVQAISIEAGIPEAIATKFGNVWVTRMLQASILMAMAVAIYRKIAKNNTVLGRAEAYAILILGLAVLVTSSLIAHAAATSQIGAMVLDFFHNAAASLWIGGVILLGFVVVPKILAIGDGRTRAAALSLIIPRFSTVIVTVLGVAVITGPVLLFSLATDLSLTLASVYGQILAIKLGLAGVMVALGAYSQFVVQRTAAAAMVGGGTSVEAGSLKNYSKTLKAEAGVGIALLLMVSLMANGALPSGQFPAYEQQRQPSDGSQTAFAEEIKTDYVRTAYTGNGKIQLAVTPFAVGQNNFRLSFFDKDGNNATGIESATIKLTQVDKGIGPITIETKKQSGNVFAADAAFSLPGTWNVEIEGVSSQGSNILATLDVNVKPQISNLDFAVKQYNLTKDSIPLFPVFDAERQAIWLGNTQPGSGMIWQFDIATGNYTVHAFKGIDIITQIVLAPDGNLWFIDPLSFKSGNGTLGMYSPDTNSSKQFKVPVEGTMSGLAMDGNGSLWMPIVQANKVVKFDPATGKFTSLDIPTANAEPVAMATDSQGMIWFAEAAGKIAKIDPATNKITEYAPKSERQKLQEPTAVFPDPKNPGTIYISDHTGHTVTAFNSLLGTFRQYPVVNQAGLPFGMAMDSYGNLWFAEHFIDRIAVIDPRTGESKEAKVPIAGSLIQYLTSDDKGRIWFAAQRGEPSLSSITITAKPSSPPPSSNGTGGDQNGSAGVPQLGFSFTDVAGPAIAIGVVISALSYTKAAVDLKRNMRAAQKLKE